MSYEDFQSNFNTIPRKFIKDNQNKSAKRQQSFPPKNQYPKQREFQNSIAVGREEIIKPRLIIDWVFLFKNIFGNIELNQQFVASLHFLVRSHFVDEIHKQTRTPSPLTMKHGQREGIKTRCTQTITTSIARAWSNNRSGKVCVAGCLFTVCSGLTG